MKQVLATVAGMIGMSMSTLVSPGTTHDVATKFAVKPLPQLTHLRNFIAAGMNPRADIAGTITVNGQDRVVVLFDTGGKHPRLLRLPLPKGLKSIAATGINSEAMVSATGTRKNGDTEALVAQFTENRYHWTVLRGSRGWTYSTSGIANSGTIAGTASRQSRLAVRKPVMWGIAPYDELVPTYLPAQFLPLRKGMSGGSATVVESVSAGPIVIGGEMDNGSPFNSKVALWTLLKRTASPPILLGGSHFDIRPPVAIGGTGKGMYVAGSVMGVDTGQGWAARISLRRKHRAKIMGFGSLSPGPFAGAECFYGAESVNANRSGKFVGVGTISCISGHSSPRPLLWQGTSVTDLNDDIIPKGSWHLTAAYAVNRNEQILAAGTFAGKQAFAFLSHR